MLSDYSYLIERNRRANRADILRDTAMRAASLLTALITCGSVVYLLFCFVELIDFWGRTW